MKHLFSKHRYRICRSIFDKPLISSFKLCFITKAAFSLTTKRGAVVSFSRSSGDHKLWDWIFGQGPRVRVDFTGLGELNIKTEDYSVVLRPNTHDFGIFREVFISDVYEINNISVPLGIVIDIGANVGLFSCAMLSKAEKVISIEPAEENFEQLKKNIRMNSGNMENILKFAITGKSGDDITIFKHKTNTGTNTIKQHLHKNNALVASEIVKTKTLSDIFYENGCDTVDFLKCDIEGAEFDVFLNAEISLLKRIKKIAMEVHIFEHEDLEQAKKMFEKFVAAGFEIRSDRDLSLINSKDTKTLMLFGTNKHFF